MSRVDDFRRAEELARSLREDVDLLLGTWKDRVTVRASAPASSLADIERLLREAMARPEARALLLSVIDGRLEEARADAVRECQDFLEAHVVRRVMED